MRPSPTLFQETVAEFVGTFVLVFVGCGAIMSDALSGGAVGHVGISLAFGAAAAAVVSCFGHISGSHINPAVTLAFWVAGVHPSVKVLPYVAAQSTGAIAAAGLLRWTLGDAARIGATFPLDGNWPEAAAAEIVLTFVLMLVICGSGLHRRSPRSPAGVTIGLTLAAGMLSMGLISGGSMNPARSLGPALISRTWEHQWLYWVAPIAGALLAVGAYRAAAPGALSLTANSIETAPSDPQRRSDERASAAE